MVSYCNNIFQDKIKFSYYNNTFRCNKVILATILIDVINLSYYYNKKQSTDKIKVIPGHMQEQWHSNHGIVHQQKEKHNHRTKQNKASQYYHKDNQR